MEHILSKYEQAKTRTVNALYPDHNSICQILVNKLDLRMHEEMMDWALKTEREDVITKSTVNNSADNTPSSRSSKQKRKKV